MSDQDPPLPPRTGEQSTFWLDTLPVAALLLTPDSRVTRANVAACALLGESEAALRGRRLTQFLAPGSQATFATLLRGACGGALQERGEGQLLRPRAAPLEVLFDFAPLDAGAGREGCLVVLTDITVYKAAQQHLLDGHSIQEQRLQERGARVRALNQELEEVVTKFIQQLQLPVARGLSFLTLLRRELGEPPEAAQKLLLNSERSFQQVSALFKSVERYLQARRMRVRLRRVDLSVVLKEVLKDARDLLIDRKVDLTHDPLPTLHGDSQALYLILNEYISNALKYTRLREVARIRLLVRETETEYHIGVQDNGAGFHMRQKDRLFELFGRLHPSSVYEGSGIGLANVRRVCERFGGRVWAEGQVDQGATFWFAWPKQPVLSE